MKKGIIFLSLVMLIFLVGCGNKNTLNINASKVKSIYYFIVVSTENTCVNRENTITDSKQISDLVSLLNNINYVKRSNQNTVSGGQSAIKIKQDNGKEDILGFTDSIASINGVLYDIQLNDNKKVNTLLKNFLR